MAKPKPTRVDQPSPGSDQGGFILVEIVVSAAMLAVVAIGVFLAFDVGTRATAEERHRARAQSLAQGDLERMQSMRIADLGGLNQTRTVTQDAQVYTVRSQSIFETETASTSTCAAGSGSRDLLRVSSTVTWPSIGTRPPVSVTSIVAPPNGSVVPNSGSLLASVKDSRANGISGVLMTGSGAGSFSGTTNAGGCVLWRNLPAGNYSLNFGGAASGKVDEEGLPPSTEPVSIVAGSTNTVGYEFDSPGRIQNVRFRTRNYSNALIDSTADSIVAAHPTMNGSRVFTATGGVRAATITTPTTLFPFPSTYSVYAGNCGENEPLLAPLALGSAMVPVGGTVAGPVLQLPSLLVTVWSGNNASSPGSPVTGGDITATEDNALCTRTVRTLTTNTDSQGRVPTAEIANVGLPYSDDYEVCANNAGSPPTRRRRISNVALTSAGSTGTTLNIYLGGSGTSSGFCP